MEKDLSETKQKLRDKEKVVKSQEQEIDQMDDTIEKLRQQLVEDRKSTLTT